MGTSLGFQRYDGSHFGLLSVDLAEYSTVFPTPHSVQFLGFRSDGGMVVAEFVTDGVIDGPGQIEDFQTFYFDPREWSGLIRVEIPHPGWSLDNLVVSIPEPASANFAAAGGLVWWILRRRKKVITVSH
ncbi:MAG TPA: hypothetical protein VN673_10465 [Clostridia bacterium]|nr:hypothetical protein [Clostridia bacterium]